MSISEMIKYDMTVEMGIATAQEINLVRCVLSGSWDYVLDSICFARTGYRDIEQLVESEEEE